MHSWEFIFLLFLLVFFYWHTLTFENVPEQIATEIVKRSLKPVQLRKKCFIAMNYSFMLILWVKNRYHLLCWKQPTGFSLLREQGAHGGQAAVSGAQSCWGATLQLPCTTWTPQLQLSSGFSCTCFHFEAAAPSLCHSLLGVATRLKN